MNTDIVELSADAAAAAEPALCDILMACVAQGASVNFLADMPRWQAEAFWQGTVRGLAAGDRRLFVARVDGALAGTVILFLAQQPNQPHRGDIGKMLVHSSMRRRGIGAALLAHAEREALAMGRTLLVLDTETGSDGERLYRRLGWRCFGAVPGFALNTAGERASASFFFKDLAPAPITVAAETPDQPEVAALLAASERFSAAHYPPESNHMLPLADLLRPDVRFFVARRAGAALGCGALKVGDGEGELKRFIVFDHARGEGVAGLILARVEAEARRLGLAVLRLETGIHSAGALALYRRHGFLPREAFPPYQPDPWSVFMEKRLG
jgi:GNAT superfamily N-acetyltransferase